MVRDVFRLAKENEPAIIFIDEVDAIATARFDAQTGADRCALCPPSFLSKPYYEVQGDSQYICVAANMLTKGTINHRCALYLAIREVCELLGHS